MVVINNATTTPGARPNLAIVIGTIKGNNIVPTIGVNATKLRKIISLDSKSTNQNHSSCA